MPRHKIDKNYYTKAEWNDEDCREYCLVITKKLFGGHGRLWLLSITILALRPPPLYHRGMKGAGRALMAAVSSSKARWRPPWPATALDLVAYTNLM